jgi:hypothetical protein
MGPDGYAETSATVSQNSYFLFFLRKKDELFLFYMYIFIHLFTCAYIVWVISPPVTLPHHLFPLPPSVPGRSCYALITNFVEEKT